MKKIFLFLIVIASLLGGGYIFYREGSLAVNKENKVPKIFVIRKGDALNLVANNLSKEGLIRNKLVFYAIVKQLGIEKTIQAGDFRLSQTMDAYQITTALTHGTLDIWVTIIEGLRREEIAQVIAKDFDVPETEFLKLAPEGYLFPDTYLIPRDASVEAIINIFKNNFDKKYNSLIKEKAKGKNLSDLDVITLASLIEREARIDEDRQQVANILLKRYRNDIPLQIDATVQYALGYQAREKSWWKKELSTDDLSVNSLYNTYKKKGLPPGPISNPGLATLRAVINADESTPYLYYVSDKKGKLHFAKTLEEHNENIRKYIQ